MKVEIFSLFSNLNYYIEDKITTASHKCWWNIFHFDSLFGNPQLYKPFTGPVYKYAGKKKTLIALTSQHPEK